MRRKYVVALVFVCLSCLAVFLQRGTGQTVSSQKQDFPNPKPVVLVKRGTTATVQWCWEPHNGRAEEWFVMKDATLPSQSDIDYIRDQRTLDIDGVHIEADKAQSNRLGEELLKNGPYTEEQKKYANTGVTGAIFHVTAAKNAPLGGRTAFIHNISGTGFPTEFRLKAELRILVTR